MAQRLRPYADQLFPYWDYPGKMRRIKWTQDHVNRQQLLIEAFRPLIQIGPLKEMSGYQWDLPMALPAVNNRGEVIGTNVLKSYRQLFDFMYGNRHEALRQFQVVYG
jgi:hypothetical protein